LRREFRHESNPCTADASSPSEFAFLQCMAPPLPSPAEMRQ
jgi:hypothetical protein